MEVVPSGLVDRPLWGLYRDGHETRIRQTGTTKMAARIDGPACIRRYASRSAAELDVECVGVTLLDPRGATLGGSIIAVGGHASVSFDARRILKLALLIPSCSAVVVGHNHLHDDVQPSLRDVEAFHHVWCACYYAGIHLLDNVIATPRRMLSFREEGYFSPSMWAESDAEASSTMSPRSSVGPSALRWTG